MLSRYKKLLWALLVVVLVGGLAFFGFNVWRSHTMATLIVDGAPADLSVVINNKEIKSPHKLYLKPGDYTLYFSRPDFSKYTKKVSLLKGKSDTVEVALNPTNAAGRTYLTSHPAAQRNLERVGGIIYNQQLGDLTKNYPIITQLPLTQAVGGHGQFSINYKTSTTDSGSLELSLIIDYVDDVTKAQALQWMTDHNFNPNNYQIQYANTLPTSTID